MSFKDVAQSVITRYSDYSACWIIQPASGGYRVKITTEDFDLESDSSCRYDLLRIMCGDGTWR